MNHYLNVLKKYVVFKGRASREEYWYYILFNTLINVLIVVFAALFLGYTGSALISLIYNFAILIPSIAVGVRRMHDVNKSGWFILVPIYNFYLAIHNGTQGPNNYGPDPSRQDDLNQLVEN